MKVCGNCGYACIQEEDGKCPRCLYTFPTETKTTTENTETVNSTVEATPAENENVNA